VELNTVFDFLRATIGVEVAIEYNRQAVPKMQVDNSNLDPNNRLDAKEIEALEGKGKGSHGEVGKVNGVGGNGGEGNTTGKDVTFGSNTKSSTKLNNQMNERGWTQDTVIDTVDNPYTTRVSVNKATGNPATAYYTKQGSYVIVDDIKKVIVQVSDNINPSTWAPDASIVNPYIPE